MIWIFILALVMGFVFFKLGSYAVWFGVLQAAVNVLLFVTGAFVLVAIWKSVARKRKEAREQSQ